MIRCGTCGLAVTAEHKYKPSGLHYIYYHCTKRRLLGPRCAEPSVEARNLEHQMERFIRSLVINPVIEAWILEQMTRDAAALVQEREVRRRLLESSLKSVEVQLAELTGMRIRNLLTDQEYLLQRAALQKQCIRLQQKGAGRDVVGIWSGAISDIVKLSDYAARSIG